MTTQFALIDNIETQGGYVFTNTDTETTLIVNNVNKDLYTIPTLHSEYIAIFRYLPNDSLGESGTCVEFTTRRFPLPPSGEVEDNPTSKYVKGGDILSFIGKRSVDSDIKIIIRLYSIDTKQLSLTYASDSLQEDNTNYIPKGQFNIVGTNIVVNHTYTLTDSFRISGGYNQQSLNKILFTKSGGDTTDTFTLKKVDYTVDVYEENAIYYGNFVCPNVTSANDYKKLSFFIGGVHDFQGQDATVCIKGKSSTNSKVHISYEQEYDNGPDNYYIGSIPLYLENDLNKYHSYLNIDKLDGREILEDNNLLISIEFPKDEEYNISVSEIQFNIGHRIVSYQFLPDSIIFAQEKALSLPNLHFLSDNYFDGDKHVLINRNYSNYGLTSYSLSDGVPVGTSIPTLSENIPYGWLLQNGETISYNKFQQLSYAISPVDPGNSAYVDVIPGPPYDRITIRNSKNGLSTAPHDGPGQYATGFTFTQVNAGSPTTQAITNIFPILGQYIKSNTYWVWYTPDGKRWITIILIDGDPLIIPPGLTDDEINKRISILKLDGTEDIVTILYKISYIYNPLGFALPYKAGPYERISDHFAGRDPDATDRKDIYGTIIGDETGSYQEDEIISHTHTSGVSYNDKHYLEFNAGGTLGVYPTGGTYGWNIYIDLGITVEESTTGGTENAAESIYVRHLIKY